MAMTTKKNYRTVVVVLICATSATAHTLRLNLYGYYAFNDKFDSYFSNSSHYNGVVKGGFVWAAGIEYQIRPRQSMELSYQRMDTKAPTTYFDNGLKFANFDLGLNYLMLGGNHYLTNHPKLQPYCGVQAGLAIAQLNNPATNFSDTRTGFACGIRLGTNYLLTRTIRIKLQAGLASAVQSVGGGFYFGTGGLGAGLSSYSSMYQFQLGGGLVFNFGAPEAAGIGSARRVS
jgi:hypothetical protein